MIAEFSPQKTNSKKTTLVTSKPLLADINYTSNLELLKNFSNYVDEIKDIENQINLSLAYYNSIVTGDPVTELSEFFIDLEENKLETLDNEFIEFWSNKFNNAIEPVKQKVFEKLGKKKNFYNNISDSVGILINTENKLDDSTTPTFDIYCNIYGAPNYIPVQLRSKISDITKNVCDDLSIKATSRFRTNLRNIYYVSPNTSPYVDSTVSHGLNLVADYKFIIDYTNILKRLFENLLNYYNRIFTFVEYYSNIKNDIARNYRDTTKSNAQKIDKFYFDIDVEHVNQNVDFLLNKIQTVLSDKTIKNTLANPVTRNSYRYSNSTNSLNINPRVSDNTLPVPYDIDNKVFDKLTGAIPSFNLDLTSYLNTNVLTDKLNINNYIPSYNFQNTPLNGLGFNTIIPTLQLPNIPNFLPSVDPTLLSDITSIASIDKYLPSFGLGSLGELAGLASTFNGGIINDPMSVFSSIEQIKNIACNFQMPTFTQPNFDFPASFFGSFEKLLNVLPKIDITNFDFSKTLDRLANNFVDNITKSFDDLYNKLFNC